MKILYIGDGRHDIGKADFDKTPRKAGGVVPELCKKIVPGIGEQSLAMQWKDIASLARDKSKKGFGEKLKRAAEIARYHDCVGIIAVVDRDNQPHRIEELRKSREELNESLESPNPIAVGEAVCSIEAWTLADPTALAGSLGIESKEVEAVYSSARVEELYENSGKAEKCPKGILKKIAQIANKQDSSDLRLEVARQTNLDTLKRNCPDGFGLFAEDVNRNFS